MVEVLFSPTAAEERLGVLPALRAALPDPSDEGVVSDAFSRWRKSPRHIWRVLGRQHWPHLAALVDELELAMSAGWAQSSLLRTPDETTFGSALSELSVARWLQRAGLAPENPEEGRGAERVPDLVCSGPIEAAFEVYSPFQWREAQTYFEALRLAVENADVPYDFRYELRMQPPEGEDYIDAWSFGEAFPDHSTWRAAIDTCARAATGLVAIGGTDGPQPFDEPSQARLTLQLTNVQASLVSPNRVGFLRPPSPPPYDAEGMFSRLLERRIRPKLSRGQATGHPGWKCLCVDIDRVGCAEEFFVEHYVDRFGSVLPEFWASASGVWDALLFFRGRYAPTFSLAVPLLVANPDALSALEATGLLPHTEPSPYAGVRFVHSES